MEFIDLASQQKRIREKIDKGIATVKRATRKAEAAVREAVAPPGKKSAAKKTAAKKAPAKRKPTW